jgi:ribosomal protein L24E
MICVYCNEYVPKNRGFNYTVHESSLDFCDRNCCRDFLEGGQKPMKCVSCDEPIPNGRGYYYSTKAVWLLFCDQNCCRDYLSERKGDVTRKQMQMRKTE